MLDLKSGVVPDGWREITDDGVVKSTLLANPALNDGQFAKALSSAAVRSSMFVAHLKAIDGAGMGVECRALL